MVYRTIETSTWTDPEIRKLSAHGKLLFVYLVTNDHTHVGGIYYIPPQLMAMETGIPIKAVNTLLDTLAGVGLIAWDTVSDVVWVRKMFDYQGKGERNAIGVANHLRTLHNCCLIPDFLRFYEHRKIPYQIPYTTSAQDSLQEQEQEQEQNSSCTEPDEPASEPPPAVLMFQTNGVGSKTWGLTQAKIDEYVESYPAVSVLDECRKALQWTRDNPRKRKTPGGMASFLNRWLTKAQDGATGNGKAPEAPRDLYEPAKDPDFQ
jgi:hypothetical protein